MTFELRNVGKLDPLGHGELPSALEGRANPLPFAQVRQRASAARDKDGRRLIDLKPGGPAFVLDRDELVLAVDDANLSRGLFQRDRFYCHFLRARLGLAPQKRHAQA